jgi:AbrB family looped-hinge helix DNA binding protein
MNAIRGKVSETGRFSIPAELRKAVGLERGGDVVVELDGRAIRIRTVDDVVAQAQAIVRDFFKDKPSISVDDFIAARHRDAETE